MRVFMYGPKHVSIMYLLSFERSRVRVCVCLTVCVCGGPRSDLLTSLRGLGLDSKPRTENTDTRTEAPECEGVLPLDVRSSSGSC